MIYIDFETRGDPYRLKAGAYEYAMDSNTRILCMGWAKRRGVASIWLPGQPLPEWMSDPLETVAAWNAGFDKRIWDRIGVLHGFPVLPLRKWYDVQADALACNLPAALDQCGEAMGLGGKSVVGHKAMMFLSRPYRGAFRDPAQHPVPMAKMLEYCQRDVELMRDISFQLPAWPTYVRADERRVWEITYEMNDRGLPIDAGAVGIVNRRLDHERALIDKRFAQMTLGVITKATQRERVKKALDVEMPNMQRPTIDETLERTDLSHRDREMLTMYRAAGHTSTAKFKRLLDMDEHTFRLRDHLKFYGAGTGRWSGRGAQFQNLPGVKPKAPVADLVTAMAIMDRDTFELCYGCPFEVAVSLVRGMIKAPPGYKLIAVDYTQIEARAVPWLSDDQATLDAFRTGKDIYKATAAEMYHVPYEQVTGDQRQAGKTTVLACGFQGGYRALQKMAAKYRFELEEHVARAMVNAFRTARHITRDFWTTCDGIGYAVAANRTAGCVPMGRYLNLRHDGKHMFMQLPSGRELVYPYAGTKEMPTGSMAMTHWHVDSYTHKWTERQMYGGLWFQNAVQAICRDIMAEAMIRLEDADYQLVLTVHDELIALVPDTSDYTLAGMTSIMNEPPTWADGFPIKAAGWEGDRYRK